jgi:hypothetical protein
MTGLPITHHFAALFDVMLISMLGTTGVILALTIGMLTYYWRNTHGL